MRRFLRTRSGRLAVLVSLTGQLSGCHKWAPPDAPIGQVATSGDKELRVTRSDGAVIVVNNARVETIMQEGAEAEVLIGEVGEVLDTIPLADLQSFEVRAPNTGATVGLVAGIVAITLAAAYIVASVEIGKSKQ